MNPLLWFASVNLVLQLLVAIENGIIQIASPGTPLTKDQFLAFLEQNWNLLLASMSASADVQKLSWAVVSPTISQVYDVVVNFQKIVKLFQGQSAPKPA